MDGGLDAKELFGFEVFDFEISFDDKSEGWGLDSSEVIGFFELRKCQCSCPCARDSEGPVGLLPKDGGLIEGVSFLIGFECLEGFLEVGFQHGAGP